MTQHRISTGLNKLDSALGGGLIPGTLAVVLGSTGIGKTQLGIHFARQGLVDEGRSGFLVDMAARGDSQNHAGYAERIAGWSLDNGKLELDDVLDGKTECGSYLRIFEAQATRVTQRDMSFDDWHHWQSEINTRLRSALTFIYGNFVRGARRLVVDGFEPADHPDQSVQFNLFEFLYHKAVREEYDWVARELFREHFLANKADIEQQKYDSSDIGCLALCTSKEQMLDDLITRPLDEGDVIANANTLILVGRTREAGKMGRAMYVAKHRGSACSEDILPFEIDDQGLKM